MMVPMGGPGAPDLSKAEIVDFTVESGENKVRLKLKDGSVIEVRVEITGILQLGNDPNTGFPIYNVQFQPIIRMVNVPHELRKTPAKTAAKDSKNLQAYG